MISYVSRGVQTEEEEKRLRDLHRTQDHKEHRALSFALPHMDDIRDSLNRRNEIRERAKSFAVGRKSVAGGFMGVVARAVAAGGSGTEDGTNSPQGDAAAGAPGDAGKRPTVRRTLTPGRVGLRPSAAARPTVIATVAHGRGPTLARMLSGQGDRHPRRVGATIKTGRVGPVVPAPVLENAHASSSDESEAEAPTSFRNVLRMDTGSEKGKSILKRTKTHGM